MPERPLIQGECDPRFARVRERFEQLIRERECGASVAIYAGGRPVVDLWGGWADPERTGAWERDTLVNVFSTTKGMTAICAHRLVDQGELDLDAPVAEYWPEFAQLGKSALPVRQLLNHQAGLAAVAAPLPGEALFDWDAMTAALAAQEPWWTPGTRHGYHALTYGWLVGEVVRRIAGRSLGTYFRAEIADPLGLDFHIGLDAEHDGRVSNLTPLPSETPGPGFVEIMEAVLKDPQGVTAKAFVNPPSMIFPTTVPSREWRGAEIPAANGHGTARSLARVYGALACGGSIDGYRILAPEGVERCLREESYGTDEVLKVTTRIGLGFMLSQPDVDEARIGPNPRAFGHPGMGGSIGFADPDAEFGFGYTMNAIGQHVLTDPRPRALIDALYAAA